MKSLIRFFAMVLLACILQSPAAAQTPQFRAASTLDGSGTLAFPAGSVSTDWLVMYVIATAAVPTPSGWTLSAGYNWSTFAYFSYVFTRQQGSDSSVTLAPAQGGAMILAYQNVGGIGAIGSVAESGGSALALNSITPQSASSVVLGLVSDRDAISPTPPAGTTSRLSFNSTYFGQNFADKAYGSTAPTGSVSWTQAATYAAIGLQLELLPPIAVPPAISLAFNPTSINLGGSSTLTFTLGNSNSTAVTNAHFTDTLTNMSVATTAIGGTCTGVTNSPALTVGATALNLNVPSVPPGGCTITLSIKSNTAGTQSTSTSGVTVAENPSPGAGSNSASLTVSATPTAPLVTVAFTPAWAATGTNSSLSFTLSNPAGITLTNAHFTDTLANMTIASTTIGGTCTGVTNSPALTVGATAINLTIPSLPAAGCKVTLTVKSTVLGSNPTTTSGVNTTQNPTAGPGSNTAYLTVGLADVGFSYVHADHLGTPRAITRPSDNKLQWQWDNVEPFGNNAPNENPASLGTYKYSLRFPGQVADAETSTNYNYYRDYDPATGRYIESDPIGLEGGLSTYLYANGNPLKFTDPSGENPVLIAGACVVIGTTIYFVWKFRKFMKCVERCTSCPNNPDGEQKVECQPLKDNGRTAPNSSCKTFCTLDGFAGPRGKGAPGSRDYP